MAIHVTSLTPGHTTVPAATRNVSARATRQSAGMSLRVAAPAPQKTASTESSAPASTPSWLEALFPGKPGTNTPPATHQDPGPPTAEQVFGPNPWLANPTGMAPDGSTYGYNAQYFATPETAAKVAAMVGGKVVEADEFTNAPGSTFHQQQPNEMVQLPNGGLINAGLVAGFFTHGYPQSMVDQMIANEVTNTKA